MKTYDVPLVARVDLFKAVRVQAVDKAHAIAEVGRMIELASELEVSDNPPTGELYGLTSASVEETINDMKGEMFFVRKDKTDFDWTLGITSGDATEVEIDRNNGVVEVKEPARPVLVGGATS